MAKIVSYEDLDIWKTSCGAVVEIYDVTKSFPKEELFGLTNQIRRAAISIPSNVAEGFGRGTDKEKKQFLIIARGSISEVKTQLYLAKQLKYINDSRYDEIIGKLTVIHKMLNKMISYLKTNWPADQQTSRLID